VTHQIVNKHAQRVIILSQMTQGHCPQLRVMASRDVELNNKSFNASSAYLQVIRTHPRYKGPSGPDFSRATYLNHSTKQGASLFNNMLKPSCYPLGRQLFRTVKRFVSSLGWLLSPYCLVSVERAGRFCKGVQ
jgi:hypothetical protein